MEDGKIVDQGAPAEILPVETLRRMLDGLPKSK
jgi:hypothetical protein